MDTVFEIIGYHVDHYNGRGKYIGSQLIDSPDRQTMGYKGRKYHDATERIVFGKKFIKKGDKYYTECVPLCGKMTAKTLEEKVALFQQAHIQSKINK